MTKTTAFRSANIETYVRWLHVLRVTQKPHDGLALAGFDLKHRVMTVGRPWSEEDIGKLKSMAGRPPAKDIAVELGRSIAATVVILKLSLRTRFQFGRTVFRQSAEPFGRERE